jgi:fatty-acyl-CoA synthase
MGEQFNLGVVNEAISAAVPEREFVVWRDRRLTYSQVAERSRRLASYLHGHGLGCHIDRSQLAGHEVGQDLMGIYAYNGNEWIESMIGGFKARVAPFNVNYRYVRDELLHLLTDANTSAPVYQATFAPRLAETRHELPQLRVLLQIADESGNDLLPGAVDYETALASADSELPPVETSPDDLYVIYTGGTTGMPKGVLWRQHDVFIACMGGRAPGLWESATSYGEVVQRAAGSEASKTLVLSPMMHGGGQWTIYMTMARGGTVVFPSVVDRLHAPDVLEVVDRERISSMTVIGNAMARPLVEELERGGCNLSSLVRIANGAAPLTPALKDRLIAAIPGLLITDGAGASETGTQMMHLSTKGEVATGTFVASPDTKVLNETKTGLVNPGHDGLGWLAQAGCVALGYKGDAPKTAATFPVVDGVRYAIPGDRARLLEGGTIELLGRDSQTINSGGEKIFAEEVEMALASHPSINDVVVTSRPSERWGQEVVAIVALADGSPTADDLIDHAARSIARYKLPRQSSSARRSCAAPPARPTTGGRNNRPPQPEESPHAWPIPRTSRHRHRRQPGNRRGGWWTPVVSYNVYFAPRCATRASLHEECLCRQPKASGRSI